MKKVLFVSAAVVVLSGSMFADTVTCATCTGGGSSSFTAPTATPTWTGFGTPPGPPAPLPAIFWNDASDDTGVGPGQGASHLNNVGYLLTDTGGFTGSTSVLGSDTATSDYVGASGVDPTAFNFVRNATAYNVTLLFADSGMNTGVNPANGLGSQIGYYLLSTPGTLVPLYTVGQTFTPTGTTAFNPGVSGTQYGFYDTVCYAASGGVCTSSETYTTANGNSGAFPAASWNHFALFQLASGSYVLGFTGQNGLFGEGQGDFQDTVIELSVVAPEPATVAIMGLGLAALGMLGRRRFVRK